MRRHVPRLQRQRTCEGLHCRLRLTLHRHPAEKIVPPESIWRETTRLTITRHRCLFPSVDEVDMP